MRQVSIYVDEGYKLDLFSDEQITVTSTGKDLTDLSAGLADFSQTFTVPASVMNNNIFEYYYNNDIDGTIDHNLRRGSWIEIDEIPFRRGKLQLEKGEVENGVAVNYTATFYGDVVTLKDLIGEDKLDSLDYSSIDHDYNSLQIGLRIKGTFNDAVKYPLISSERYWTNSGGGTDDITTLAYGIEMEELFPAIRLTKILEFIETKYGITFGGSWLSSTRFTPLSLWFKNKEENIFISPQQPLYNDNDITFTNGYIFEDVHYTYRDPSTLTTIYDGNVFFVRHNVSVTLNTTTTSQYYLDVYSNGTLITTLSSPTNGGNYTFNVVVNQQNTASLDETYRFKVRSKVSATFTGSLDYVINYRDTNLGGTVYLTESHTNPIESVTTLTKTDMASLAPNMKIIDFLSGVLKYGNCVLTSPSEGVYSFINTNNYYNSGTIYNITGYVDEKSITYARPPLYKNINFEYQESKSVINRAFYDLFSRNFGDLTNTFDYDGSDYTVQMPFENILEQKFTGTDLQVGYCIDTDNKGYIPSPVLLAELPVQSGVSFYFEGSLFADYVPFGQDHLVGASVFSTAFNLEVSSFYLTPNNLSLYNVYYKDYLDNLYNPKTRLVTLKTNLPIRVLTDLEMNDKLYIRDKVYIIVDMKTNLVTGDVSFTLLSWWNANEYNKEFPIYTTQDPIPVPYEIGEGGTIEFDAIEDSFTTLLTPVNENGSVVVSAEFSELGVETENSFTVTVTDKDGTSTENILIFTRID